MEKVKSEKMTAKKYLSRLREMDDLLNLKAKELLEQQMMITSLGSNCDIKVQSSNTSNKTQDMAIKLAMLQQEAVAQCFELVQFRTKVMKMISRMKFDYQVIVYDYYIQNNTFEKVACDMKISTVWVQNLHTKMLAEFQKIMDEQGITE